MVDYWGRSVGAKVSSSDFKNDIIKYGDKYMEQLTCKVMEL